MALIFPHARTFQVASSILQPDLPPPATLSATVADALRWRPPIDRLAAPPPLPQQQQQQHRRDGQQAQQLATEQRSRALHQFLTGAAASADALLCARPLTLAALPPTIAARKAAKQPEASMAAWRWGWECVRMGPTQPVGSATSGDMPRTASELLTRFGRFELVYDGSPAGGSSSSNTAGSEKSLGEANDAVSARRYARFVQLAPTHFSGLPWLVLLCWLRGAPSPPAFATSLQPPAAPGDVPDATTIPTAQTLTAALAALSNGGEDQSDGSGGGLDELSRRLFARAATLPPGPLASERFFLRCTARLLFGAAATPSACSFLPEGMPRAQAERECRRQVCARCAPALCLLRLGTRWIAGGDRPVAVAALRSDLQRVRPGCLSCLWSAAPGRIKWKSESAKRGKQGGSRDACACLPLPSKVHSREAELIPVA